MAEVTELAHADWHEEVVALVRCGVARAEAMAMDTLERQAFLVCYSQQEEEAARAARSRAG